MISTAHAYCHFNGTDSGTIIIHDYHLLKGFLILIWLDGNGSYLLCVS